MHSEVKVQTCGGAGVLLGSKLPARMGKVLSFLSRIVNKPTNKSDRLADRRSQRHYKVRLEKWLSW